MKWRMIIDRKYECIATVEKARRRKEIPEMRNLKSHNFLEFAADRTKTFSNGVCVFIQ